MRKLDMVDILIRRRSFRKTWIMIREIGDRIFLPNIDALKKSRSEHKLFLTQSTAQSLQVNTI